MFGTVAGHVTEQLPRGDAVFHRSEYVLDGRRMKSTWFQIGDRIFFHRQRAV